MDRRRQAIVLLLAACVTVASGCHSYNVNFVYPSEGGGNIFNERPEASLYVAEPIDLRPSVERQGGGKIVELHFPSDDKYEVPASAIVRRALLQDLAATQVARLVSNPDLADYTLQTELLSMSTSVRRKAGAFAIPLMLGVAAGSLGALDVDASHGVKLGLVALALGTLVPGPNRVAATVEMRLELRDRVTDEVLWDTVCIGTQEKTAYMGLSAREDKKLAEDYLPKALKKANACAVGQLYQYLEQARPVQPAGG